MNQNLLYPNNTPTGQFGLFDYQLDTLNQMLETYKKYPIQANTSNTGSGKTFLAMGMAAVTESEIFYVGPKSSITKMKETFTQYKVPLLAAYNYDDLKAGAVKAGWIMKVGTTFSVTSKFDGKRVLLVVDEFNEYSKTGSQKFDAMICIIRYFKECGFDNQHVLLMSATPLETEDKAEAFLELFALSNTGNYFEKKKVKGVYIPSEIQQSWNILKEFDAEKTAELSQRVVKNQTEMNKLYLDIITEVLKKHLFLAMSDKPKIVHNYYDYFSLTSKEDTELLKNTVKRIPGYGDLLLSNDKLVLNEIPLKSIHKAMQESMANVAERILQEKPNSKVVLYVTARETLEYLQEELYLFRPLVLAGTDRAEKRREKLEKFNRSDLVNRLFITTYKVGSESIELDDKDGNFPRFLLMLPTNPSEMLQAAGRVCRMDTKSCSNIYVLFNRNFSEQALIHKKLARKNMLIRQTRQQVDDTLFPGEYTIFIEKDDDESEENIASLKKEIEKARENLA